MKFVVAFVNFFDNDLKIKIVDAKNWRKALKMGFNRSFEGDTLEDAKANAFEQDCLFDVEIV